MTEESIDGIVGTAMSETKERKSRKRKTHEVEKEHQELYDQIIDTVFDPAWHRNTVQQHNDAYITAVGYLKGKTVSDRFKAEEALVDALIKYRTEAGLPVSKDPKHRHHVYQEVRHLLDAMDEGQLGEQLAGKVDSLLREGNLYQLFEIIHKRERGENIGRKISYELNKIIPHDKEPDFYQGLLKAYGNNVGKYFKKGDLARLGNRDTLIKEVFTKHYTSEMDRIMEEYVEEEKKGKGHQYKKGEPQHAEH